MDTRGRTYNSPTVGPPRSRWCKWRAPRASRPSSLAHLLATPSTGAVTESRKMWRGSVLRRRRGGSGRRDGGRRGGGRRGGGRRDGARVANEVGELGEFRLVQ